MACIFWERRTRIMETYSESEWDGAIASLGRLVDIRNFPDVAADALMGRIPAFLGRGLGLRAKALDPSMVGAVVFWTKGPIDLLVDHPGLKEVLETYDRNRAVIGIELSVTGLGGTFLEPGIQSPEETAIGLKRVFETGLVDPEAVVVRYDPLLVVRAPDGRIIRNDTRSAFEAVVSLFSALGVRHVETKELLLGEEKGTKYFHVWQRMTELGIHPLPMDDFPSVFAGLSEVAARHNVSLFSCCMKAFLTNWTGDSGCLSAKRLTAVGRRRFGGDWDRLSFVRRSSRPGCDCSRYLDLSNVKGHKKCGSQEAACVYCTASCKKFGSAIKRKLALELEAYGRGEREEVYAHLLTG
jgi:Domain of unknown function (DUF1848)